MGNMCGTSRLSRSVKFEISIDICAMGAVPRCYSFRSKTAFLFNTGVVTVGVTYCVKLLIQHVKYNVIRYQARYSRVLFNCNVKQL